MVPIGGTRVRLRVLRLPSGDGEESELECSSGTRPTAEGTYPAGRFVTLLPGRRRPLPAGLQSGAQPVLRLQLGLPLSGPVARKHDPGAGRAGEQYGGGGLVRPGRARGAPGEPDVAGAADVVLLRVARPPPAGRGGRCSTSRVGRCRSRSRSGSRRRLVRAALQRRRCQPLSRGPVQGTASILEIADYAATIAPVSAAIPSRRVVPQRRATAGPGSFPSGRRGAAGRGRRRPPCWWAAGTPRSSRISGRVRGLRAPQRTPTGLEGTMISNTGDYGHFWRGRGGQLRAGAFRRLIRLSADRRAPRRHAARGVSRRPSHPDAVDRSAEHWGAAPQGTDRDHPADTTAPFRFAFPGSRRADGDPARTRDSGTRWCWSTSSGAGARPATTPLRRWCGYSGSIMRGGSRSSAWPTR